MGEPICPRGRLASAVDRPKQGDRRGVCTSDRPGLPILLAAALLIVTLSISGAAPRQLSGTASASAPCGLSSPIGLDCRNPTPGTTLRVQSSALTWINVTASSAQHPRLDLWASMAFDPSDHEVVLFGGCTSVQCPAAAETWTFSGGTWSNATGQGPQPPARSYAAMAYDSSDAYVLMFGGVGASSAYGDTWAFSGGRWTNLTSAVGRPVPPRWGESLSYDPVDRSVLLFGGMSAQGSVLNDTWTYSGGTWRNITAIVSPPPRYEASMVWDANDSELLLLDGCGATSCPLNDSWTFSQGTWSALPGSPGSLPPARYLSAMTFDAAAGVVRLFGGVRNGASLGDTWTYQSGRWTSVTPASSPRGRGGSAVAESTEAWLPNGAAVVWPFEVLWGGDWIPCGGCALRGFEDTWVFEVPPQVSAAPPSTSLLAGEGWTFRATASGGTPPFLYDWSFGDGASGTGPNVTHSYAAAGRYQLHLVVEDFGGATAWIAYDVNVTASASPVLVWAAATALAGGAAIVAAVVAIRARRKRPPA